MAVEVRSREDFFKTGKTKVYTLTDERGKLDSAAKRVSRTKSLRK